jgi:hypothetical protein
MVGFSPQGLPLLYFVVLLIILTHFDYNFADVELFYVSCLLMQVDHHVQGTTHSSAQTCV